jgi:hypothetical protein
MKSTTIFDGVAPWVEGSGDLSSVVDHGRQSRDGIAVQIGSMTSIRQRSMVA